MSRQSNTDATARLEARIPAEVYSDIQRAAELQGLTVTSYIVAKLGEDARKVIESADVIKLSRQDQVSFAKALLTPPKPNAKLKAAAKRHVDLIASE
jgi:uncharacterized protein (DUF1778 family)